MTKDIPFEVKEPLHSLFGKYRQSLNIDIEVHPITHLSFKQSSKLMEKFSDVRNNHSLAHANKLISPEEARYIFDEIVATLQFIEAIEPLDHKETL